MCYTELCMDIMNIMTGKYPTVMRAILALREKVVNKKKVKLSLCLTN
jgi:hypothetical protein